MTERPRTHGVACRLDGVPASVGSARRFVVDQLRQVAELGDDALDSARLVTSELVTNAVNAGSPHVTVTVIPMVDAVRIEVRDTAAGMPRLRPMDTDNPHGRGLHLIAHSATDWGYAKTDDGKLVWATIAVR